MKPSGKEKVAYSKQEGGYRGKIYKSEIESRGNERWIQWNWRQGTSGGGFDGNRGGEMEEDMNGVYRPKRVDGRGEKKERR